MDRYFLHSLMSYKIENGREGSDIPNHELKRARRELNSHFGSRITEIEVIQLVEILAQRYRSYNFMRVHDGVDFDENSARMMATDEVWEKIIEKNEFAKAYYHNGEPEFMRLELLFGTDDTTKDDVVDLDEVTSPISVSARRKLFDSEAMDINTDHESTTHMSPHHSRNALPPPYKGSRSRNLFKNMYSSSCGSSSPSPSSKK